MSNKTFIYDQWTYDQWFAFSDKFKERQRAGYSVNDCLRCFLVDAGFIGEGEEFLRSERSLPKPEREESLDMYFERKMRPVWDYVHDSNNDIKKLKERIAQLEQKNNGLFQTQPYYSPYPPYTVTCATNKGIGYTASDVNMSTTF